MLKSVTIFATTCATLGLLWLHFAEAKDFDPDNAQNPPTPLFWCPAKSPGQQLSVKNSEGCAPLYDDLTEEAFRARARQEGVFLSDRDPVKAAELQQVAGQFMDRYHTFLSCCSTSPDAKSRVFDLADEANHILKTAQRKGMVNVTGQGTLSQLLTSVASARENLFRLEKRLEDLDASRHAVEESSYEAGGRARTTVQEQEDAIRKEFKAARPPSSAPTGMEIQDTTLQPRIGDDIEDTRLAPHSGVDIGAASLRPRRGDAIQDSALPSRAGTDALETTIPNSTGRDIEQAESPASTVPLRGVGSAIGDSELNTPRR